MAGYYLYSFNYEAFTQLVNTPTIEQGGAIADWILENFDATDVPRYLKKNPEFNIWSRDREALANQILDRLPLPDWYSDLIYENAVIWERVISALRNEAGDAIGIDFDVSDFESIYWDCAEEAATFGATMMAEGKFGHGGFRYFGKPAVEWQYWPMYSLYPPEKAKELLSQLEAIEPHMATLPEGEFSPKEQFFEGLLPFVREMVERGRMIHIQTDT